MKKIIFALLAAALLLGSFAAVDAKVWCCVNDSPVPPKK